jgi:hypothetical protein
VELAALGAVMMKAAPRPRAASEFRRSGHASFAPPVQVVHLGIAFSSNTRARAIRSPDAATLHRLPSCITS